MKIHWGHAAVLAITAAIWTAIAFIAFLAFASPRPAHAESRLYPYAGASYRLDSVTKSRVFGEVGAAYSLGRLAPSVTGIIAVPETGRPGVVGVEFRVRWKIGH